MTSRRTLPSELFGVNYRLYSISTFEHHLRQDIDFLEYFAGAANTTRFMRCAELRSAKFDLLYFEPKKQGKRKGSIFTRKTESNFMDLLTPSGFLFLAFQLDMRFRISTSLATNPTVSPAPIAATPRLALIFVLKGRCKPGFLVVLATKCSSMVGINVGTSGRSKCNSIGLLDVASVLISNALTERTVLFCLFHARNFCSWCPIGLCPATPI